MARSGELEPKVPAGTAAARQAAVLRVAYGRGQHQFGDLRLPAGEVAAAASVGGGGDCGGDGGGDGASGSRGGGDGGDVDRGGRVDGDGASGSREKPYPVVVLIHGGAWRTMYHLDLMELLAQDLAERGYASWNVEYRRVGHRGGGWPGTFHDVANGLDFLRVLAREHPLDLDRVLAIGHSAGGHLALWLAGRERLEPGSELRTGREPVRLAGVIAQAGIADLHEFWVAGGEDYHDVMTGLVGAAPHELPERWAEASPAALLPLGVPQVLVHGTEDDTVPVELSRGYAARAAAAGDEVELIELARADHFAVLCPDLGPWVPTVAAVERLLGGR